MYWLGLTFFPLFIVHWVSFYWLCVYWLALVRFIYFYCVLLYDLNNNKQRSRWHALKGSHGFHCQCHPHVYPRMEWAIMPQGITALWSILISRPTEGRRLSWPMWLVTYRGGMPARRRYHPPQYQPTDSAAAGDRTHDHWVSSPTL